MTAKPTSLARQLQKLSLPESNFGNFKSASRLSLLFDPKVAASLDKDTYYALGLNGFQELCGLDSSLHQLYFETLFSEVAADTERTLKSKEFNQNLDSQIDSFLLMLSPYVLLRPAQKCIEWLLYRFRINLFNVDSLMKCAFPYYRTNIFVRIIQLLDGKQKSHEKWTWVTKAQDDGTPLTQNDVVLFCSKNVWFLEFICKALVKSVEIYGTTSGSWQIRGMLNFFTSTVLGVMYSIKSITEKYLIVIMPIVVKGIKSKLLDFQASSLMIISQMVISETFNENSLVLIVNSVTKYCLPQLHKQAIHMLALLCHYQEKFTQLNKSSFRRLSAWDDLLEAAVELASTAKSDQLLLLIFQRLIPKAFSSADIDLLSSADSDDGLITKQENFHLLLKSLIENVELSNYLQLHVFKLLISNYSNCQGEINDLIKDVIHRMQKKYSRTFDAFVAETLDSSDVCHEVMQKFLATSLVSAKHQLVGDSSIPLSFAISHPEPAVRQLAVKKLKIIFSSSDSSDETKLFGIDALLNILSSNEKPQVIAEAVQVVHDFYSTFNRQDGKILEHIIDLIEKKWNDCLWNNALKICIKTLVKNCPAKEEVENLPKQSALTNKTLLIVLRLLLERACNPKHWLNKALLEEISSFTIVTQHPILSLLVQKGKTFPSLMKVYIRELSDENICSATSELTSAAMSFVNNKFYSSLLIFLLRMSMKITDASIISTTLGHMLKATRCLYKNQADFVVSIDSSGDLLKKAFTLDDAESRSVVIWSLLLHLWKDFVTDITQQIVTSFDYSLLLSPEKLKENSAGLLLSNIFRLLLDFVAYPTSSQTQIFIQGLFTTFMKKVFDSASDALLFLSNFAINSLLSSWNDEKNVDVRHSIQTYQVASTLIGCGAIQSSKNPSCFTDSSFVVPSLLLACASSTDSVRSAAVNVLRNLIQIPRISYKELLDYLSSHFEEIILDPCHCSHAVKCYFDLENSTSKEKKIKTKILSDLLTSHVVQPLLKESYPDVAVKLYDNCLFQVDNSSEFDVIIPCVDELLQKYLNKNREPTTLECYVLDLFLHKITAENCTDVRKGEVFVKALKVGPNMLEKSPDCKLIPQLIALEYLQGSFFKSLDSKIQEKILGFLITIKSSSRMEEISTAATKAFKAISISSSLITNKLKEWNLLSAATAEKKNVIEVKRAKKQKTIDDSKVQPAWWKDFVVFMEFLHHKKRIQQPEHLIGPLFTILMDVIEEKYTADNLDYVTLLLLGGLLNLFDKKSMNEISPDKVKFEIKVELLVRCIHSTQNTQTHQHALMLLAKAAKYCPDKVLHSVMSIFTFMGSTLLRRDDAYSFQVITQTIQTIVPPLLKLETKRKTTSSTGSVLGILRVFVDSLPHIPTHRRLMVLEELLDKVGADVYLWQLMVLMTDQHVCQQSKNASNDGNEESVLDDAASKMEESFLLWTSISQLFSIKMRIKCILNMINFLQTQLNQSDEAPANQNVVIIDFSQRSTNQIRRFHVIMLTLSSYIIKSVKTSSEQRVDDDDDDSDVDRLLECALMYLSHVSRECHGNSDVNKNETTIRYQKTIVRKVNDLLEKINSLLSLHNFLQQLYLLLESPSISERALVLKKVIYLFQGRITRSAVKFTEGEQQILFKLSRKFLSMLRDGCVGEKESFSEAALHTAALGLTSIVRITCKSNPNAFVDTQPIICDVICSRELSDNLLSALLACLGEVIINLKAHCIINLAKVSSCLIDLLAKQQLVESDSVLISLLTTINKLFSCLGHFLSPYVKDFLAKLSILSRMKYLSGGKSSDYSTNKSPFKPTSKRTKMSSTHEAPPHQVVVNVLQVVMDKVATRVWVPILGETFDKIRTQEPLAVRSLVSVVSQRIDKLKKDELSQYSSKLMNFYLHSMKFRSLYKEMNFDDINGIETLLLNGVITLLVKLPETVFRPLYMKLYDWGCFPDVAVGQAITFYHCTSLMAARLKGLFEIFATDLLEDLCRELEHSPLTLEQAGREEETKLKLTCVLRTLTSMLNFSSQDFLNQERFEMIFEPLLRQIEIEFSSRDKTEDYFNNHVIACVRYLAGAIRGNISWQPFNHCILMKTRHSSPYVRSHALECLKVTVEELGEEYMTQLPESIPFLTELLEDESDEVEKYCHKVIKHIEEVLGEPLQRYF